MSVICYAEDHVHIGFISLATFFHQKHYTLLKLTLIPATMVSLESL